METLIRKIMRTRALLIFLVLLLTQCSSHGNSGRASTRSRFYYLDGTGFVARVNDSTAGTARMSIFPKGADPHSNSDVVTIYPEHWKSRIAARPSTTDTLYVEPGITVESSSGIVILPVSSEEIDAMEGALTYWYSDNVHKMWTGSVGTSYRYMIDQIPTYLMSDAPDAYWSMYFLRHLFLLRMVFLLVAALIAYLVVRYNRK